MIIKENLTIQEAITSRHIFRRKIWEHWYCLSSDGSSISKVKIDGGTVKRRFLDRIDPSIDDILANDWQIGHQTLD